MLNSQRARCTHTHTFLHTSVQYNFSNLTIWNMVKSLLSRLGKLHRFLSFLFSILIPLPVSASRCCTNFKFKWNAKFTQSEVCARKEKFFIFVLLQIKMWKKKNQKFLVLFGLIEDKKKRWMFRNTKKPNPIINLPCWIVSSFFYFVPFFDNFRRFFLFWQNTILWNDTNRNEVNWWLYRATKAAEKTSVARIFIQYVIRREN